MMLMSYRKTRRKNVTKSFSPLKLLAPVPFQKTNSKKFYVVLFIFNADLGKKVSE